ncbi:MAG: CPBP family intramembrane metalloprotease [Clostridia bacterium]|nr:CPBP family intramembrane metalloprotease [Clostridia bacterium]
MENYSIKNLSQGKKSGLSFSFMIVAYIFISFFGQPIVKAIFGAGSAFTAICSTFSVLAMALTIFLFAKLNQEKNLGFLHLKKCKSRYYVLAIGVSAGMFFGLGFINGVVAELFSQMGLNVNGSNISLRTPLHLFVFSISFAVLPAIFEECFFRGVVYGGLNGVSKICAIVSVSLCFAIYHGSVTQLVYQLIYGAVLCLLFECSNSIIPCMIAHFLNNFTVILIEYLDIFVNLYDPLIICIGLLILAVSVFFIVKEVIRKPKEETGEKIVEFWLPFGAFGSIVCLSLAILSLFAGV